LIGIFLFPCFKKNYYESILIALSALACSTLLSDAMLHIIPDILGIEHEHNDDDNEPLSVPDHVIYICIVIASLYVSWLINIISSRLGGGHGHVSLLKKAF
jgi:hypothetical protein